MEAYYQSQNRDKYDRPNRVSRRMKGCAVAGQRGLYRWVHRDLALRRTDFPVAVGLRLQIVGVQKCAVSKNAAPQNSSLVEEI